jgi:hypothetical protein
MLNKTTFFTIFMLTSVISSGVLAQSLREQQFQACENDAFRLCGEDIPDEQRITACMSARRSELSAGCRVFFTDPAPQSSPQPNHAAKRKTQQY